MDDSDIYIYRDGNWFGPYTLEQKDRYLAEGKLLLTDHYWYKGMKLRKPMGSVSFVHHKGNWTGPYLGAALGKFLDGGIHLKSDYIFYTGFPMRAYPLEGVSVAEARKGRVIFVMHPRTKKILSFYGVGFLLTCALLPFKFLKDIPLVMMMVLGVAFVVFLFIKLMQNRGIPARGEALKTELYEEECFCKSGQAYRDCHGIWWSSGRMMDELCPCGSGKYYKDCCITFYVPPKTSGSSETNYSSGYSMNPGGMD